MILLETRQLSVHAGEKWACKALDLAVSSGERWGILGVNGVGKTSLMLALSGIRPPHSGEIRLKSKPIEGMNRRDMARISGMLFQDSEDRFPSTLLETALIGRHPHIPPWQREGKADEEAALRALHEVGLSGMENRLAGTLSGGERRRLALATLLVQDPELFLLDEPTNHLDIRHQVEMLDLLKQRTEHAGKAIVMILHDPNLAERYCDHTLLLLGEGQCLLGKKEDVLTESNLSLIYRHPIVSTPGPHGKFFLPA